MERALLPLSIRYYAVVSGKRQISIRWIVDVCTAALAHKTQKTIHNDVRSVSCIFFAKSLVAEIRLELIVGIVAKL